MRRVCAPGDVVLGHVQLVAPFADVGRDPVPLAELAESVVLRARLVVGLAAPRTGPRRLAHGSTNWADAAVLLAVHEGQLIYFDNMSRRPSAPWRRIFTRGARW